MFDLVRGWLQDRRHAKAARDAMCAHNGSEPWCDECAFAFNPPA